MKISQLIGVLEDLKESYGDKHIWNIDGLDFPLPEVIEVSLTSVLKRTEFGFTGGKSGQNKEVEIILEFEDGVDLVDRCIRKRDF